MPTAIRANFRRFRVGSVFNLVLVSAARSVGGAGAECNPDCGGRRKIRRAWVPSRYPTKVNERRWHKEGRYPIALPMMGQWVALRHHSLAFHGPRRNGVRRSLGEGGATDQGGAISDRPAHEGTMGSAAPSRIGLSSASADGFRRSLTCPARRFFRILAGPDFFVIHPGRNICKSLQITA